jgi:hypothetical protein
MEKIDIVCYNCRYLFEFTPFRIDICESLTIKYPCCLICLDVEGNIIDETV